MDFKKTTLWRSAFADERSDATREEQERLADAFEQMRIRAAALVAKIAADLPHMTIHDVTHLDALWEMGSIASSTQFNLNPAEAFVFGGAVLLHDAAMTVAAYPGGISELKQTTEWRDLNARLLLTSIEDDSITIADIENRATEDALRLLHAKQAENLPSVSWTGPHGEQLFLIDDPQIRNFYGPKIGKIAYSHWWSIAKVEEELAGTLGALPGVTTCTVDLLKVACLLRVSDAMHLDQRRATAFEFALTQPTGVSADHWKFQERMAKPFVQGDALVYTAQPPFEVEVAEAWWTAFDALQMVDGELRSVDRALRDRQKTPLVVRRVEGIQSPTDLARTVETAGWTPVDSTVRVTDVPKIVATLGGNKLYGSSTAAPLRELIQNGLDAITARRRLQSRPSKWGELQVSLETRDDGHWLSVEDNGVGMSTVVLTGPLVDFGNSLWRSSLAIQEFPGLASAGMKARGKYGIGFFSVFMLGDLVRVATRRFDRDLQSAKVLEFCHGIGSRPNLRDALPSEVPLDGGTRVEVRLRNPPNVEDGLLWQRTYPKGTVRPFADFVNSIAPATDVAIKVISDGKTLSVTGPSDWLEIDSTSLLQRISPTNRKTASLQPHLELTEIRDDEGKIYGRARIEANTLWSGSGLITVDGLAAGSIRLVGGILLGLETTAARNSASPIVPGPVLASWASEQALTIAEADLTEDEKAQAAAVVMALGGDVGNLPIVWWKNAWMSVEQFEASVKNLDRLVVHEGNVSHDEDDDVTKREFESSFEADEDIAQTVSDLSIRSVEWVGAVTGVNRTTPIQVLEQALVEIWDAVEEENDAVVIGRANGTEIYRGVNIYTRAAEEDDQTD